MNREAEQEQIRLHQRKKNKQKKPKRIEKIQFCHKSWTSQREPDVSESVEIIALINRCAYLFSVNTLMLGKPEKGKMVESMLLRMAQGGQIAKKIGEQDLIGILESVNAQIPQSKTSVKFDRRRAALDSDDEDF